MIALPAIRASNQVRALAVGYLIFLVLYLGSAGLQLRPPLMLRPGIVESVIPFFPWSIWIYLSQFLLLPWAIVSAGAPADRSRVFYAMLVATSLAAIVFVVFPTGIERSPPVQEGITGWAWEWLYQLDTSFNCFPSLHVALAALAGMALSRRGWRWAAIAWPAAIAVSTIATRQHVAIDIAGGLVLAEIAWRLVPRLVRHE